MEGNKTIEKNTGASSGLDLSASASDNIQESTKSKKNLFEKISGLFYRVQIAATKRSSAKNTNWFNSKYHINTEVELTYQEGWKKYLIGQFTAYEDAKKYRNKTKERIPDAFVVAYENGTIISVRDALHRKTINP
jgi:hypothetical protein